MPSRAGAIVDRHGNRRAEFEEAPGRHCDTEMHETKKGSQAFWEESPQRFRCRIEPRAHCGEHSYGTSAISRKPARCFRTRRLWDSEIADYRGAALRTDAPGRCGTWRCNRQASTAGPSNQVGLDGREGWAVEGERTCQGPAPVPCGQEPISSQKGDRYKGVG